MLNEQVAGMLRNNAGNPNIVKRIAQENDLSQTEVAQTLRIPEAAASRYMPDMNPEQGMEAGPIDGGMVKPTPMATKPGMQPPQVPMAGDASVGMAGGGAEKPQMATQIPFTPGSASFGSAGGGVASVGGGMASGSTGGGLSSGSVGGGISSGSAGSAGAPSISGAAVNALTAGSAGGGMQMGSAGGGFSPAITPQMSQPFLPAGGMSTPVKPGSIPQMSQPMRPPMGEKPSPVGVSGFGNVPVSLQQAQTKPLPVSMKPQGLAAPSPAQLPAAGFRGRAPLSMPQAVQPSAQKRAPAAPAPAAVMPRTPARVPTADQAFISGFNRIRGARA